MAWQWDKCLVVNAGCVCCYQGNPINPPVYINSASMLLTSRSDIATTQCANFNFLGINCNGTTYYVPAIRNDCIDYKWVTRTATGTPGGLAYEGLHFMGPDGCCYTTLNGGGTPTGSYCLFPYASLRMGSTGNACAPVYITACVCAIYSDVKLPAATTVSLCIFCCNTLKCKIDYVLPANCNSKTFTQCFVCTGSLCSSCWRAAVSVKTGTYNGKYLTGPGDQGLTVNSTCYEVCTPMWLCNA